jgi:cytochrome P450
MSETAENSAGAGFSFNPSDEKFRRNPYPYFHALLAAPPPLFKSFIPVAVVARYRDVSATLRDHLHFSSVPIRRMSLPTTEIFGSAPNVVSSDPPIHTRLRRAVSADFTPRRIREMEPRIREIADELTASIAKKGDFDLMADFAIPLPVMSIAALLGIPLERHETFKQWSEALMALTSLAPGAPMPDAVRTNLVAMRDYFAEEIDKRRRESAPDLISSLVAAHEEGGTLGPGEVMQFLILLLMAGNETTSNMIGNGMLALMRHPDQALLVRREPALLPRAIEEMLRYDGPVLSIFRTATEDTEISGTAVEKGTGIFVLLAAANHDPAQFRDPDTFDILREPNDHLAFGDGVHFCLGAPLARMEAAIAFETILKRFPHLRLVENASLDYKPSFFFRGLNALPMRTE